MHTLQCSVGLFLTLSLVSRCVFSNTHEELKFWSRDPKFETKHIRTHTNKNTTPSTPTTKLTSPTIPTTKLTTPTTPTTPSTNNFTLTTPTTNKTTPKTPAAKKTTPKTPATKKTTPKTPATKETTPKTPAAKKTTPKTPATKKTTPKTPATKETTPKTPATKKTTTTTKKSTPETPTTPITPTTSTTSSTPTGPTIKINPTTVEGRVLLEQVITNTSQGVLKGLKAIRKSGFSLDGLVEDIDKIEGDIKAMDFQNEMEDQLQRIKKPIPLNFKNESYQNKDDVSARKRLNKKKHTLRKERHRKKKKGLKQIKKKNHSHNNGRQKYEKEHKHKKSNKEKINKKKELLLAENKEKLANHNVSNSNFLKPVTPITTRDMKRKAKKTGKNVTEIKSTIVKDELKKEISEKGNEILRQAKTHSWPREKSKNHRMINSKERVTRMDTLLMREPKEDNKTADKGEKNHSDLRSDIKEPEEKLTPFTIKKQLQKICECEFPGTNITLSTLGRTVEYNDIVLLKVAAKNDKACLRSSDDKYAEDVPEKKIVFIVHGLSTMGINNIPCLTVVKKWKRLLSFYFNHLDKFNIFVVPMANPDGVAYAASAPIWNKNMSPQSECPGVCLDRNFDVAWNGSRTVSSCSQQYPGLVPFSEPETRAIRDVFHRFGHKIIAYLHVHAGAHTPMSSFKGDAVLYPRGYTEHQSDDDRYIDLRGEIDEAMKNASFKMYSVAMDTLANWYGKVAGSSVDFASTVYGIPYAMELAMQPLGSNPYIDDEDKQEPNLALEEVWRRVIDTIFNNVYKSLKITTKDE